MYHILISLWESSLWNFATGHWASKWSPFSYLKYLFHEILIVTCLWCHCLLSQTKVIWNGHVRGITWTFHWRLFLGDVSWQNMIHRNTTGAFCHKILDNDIFICSDCHETISICASLKFNGNSNTVVVRVVGVQYISPDIFPAIVIDMVQYASIISCWFCHILIKAHFLDIFCKVLIFIYW